MTRARTPATDYPARTGSIPDRPTHRVGDRRAHLHADERTLHIRIVMR